MSLRPIEEAADGLSKKMPWEKQFIQHFKSNYNLVKSFDKYNLLSLDEQKLTQDFAENYRNCYDDITKSITVPDRHKAIAMLTKAFFDAEPFKFDFEKFKSLHDKDKSVVTGLHRAIVFPNEYFAIDICTIILERYGKMFHEDSKYWFVFPEHVYIYGNRTKDTDYKFELFLLYRHYINNKKNKFSIYQMAHLYFLLEMGCDIAKYGNGDKYYV